MDKLEKLSRFLDHKITELNKSTNSFEVCLNSFLDEKFEQSNSWDEESTHDVTFTLTLEDDEHYEITCGITTDTSSHVCSTDRGDQEWTETHATIEEIIQIHDLILEEEVHELSEELENKLINKLEI